MDKDVLIFRVKQGKTIREISELEGKSFSTVRYWLGKYGLKTKYKEDAGKTKCPCGETNPTLFYKNRKTLCKKCDNARVLEKSVNTRKKAIDFLGGKCESCGFNKSRFALDIHHIDPTKKDETFGSMSCWSWDRVEKELSNCALLCKNCHAMVHSGEIDGFLKTNVNPI